jgi:hypothetical protein
VVFARGIEMSSNIQTSIVYTSGATLTYSITSLPDDEIYDFSTNAFSATPVTELAVMVEATGNFIGRYTATLPIQLPDGTYILSAHDAAKSNCVVAEKILVIASKITIRNNTSAAIDITVVGLGTTRLFPLSTLSVNSNLLDMTGQIATLLAAGDITTTSNPIGG